MLVNMIVEIDGKAKTISLASADTAPSISLRKMIPFKKAGMPIIALQAGAGNSVNCLFDTGYSGFFSLKNTDFDALKSTGAFTVLSEGYGGASMGCRWGVSCCNLLSGSVALDYCEWSEV